MLPEIHVGNSEKIKPNIIARETWILDREIKGRSSLVNAVNCLEYLIENNFSVKDQLAILEIGPKSLLSITRLARPHVAPIKLLHERNPSLMCIAAGLRGFDNKEERERVLGDVEFVSATILPGRMFAKESKKVLDKLGRNPDIIYAQHVIEDSPSRPFEVFGGSEGIFEKSAEILAPNGFLVIDNYGGREDQIYIGEGDSYPHSKMMGLHSVYEYSEDKGIYVYRKPN